MDISICFADFPTETIGDTTRAYRQLGIGYANLGALLMATGHAYDSDGGRAHRRRDHLADDRHRLPTLGRAGRRRRPVRRLRPQRRARTQRVMRKHAAANDSVRPVHAIDRRCILDLASKDLAAVPRARRGQRLAQRPGLACWLRPAPSAS